jgi:hypothetical protein
MMLTAAEQAVNVLKQYYGGNDRRACTMGFLVTAVLVLTRTGITIICHVAVYCHRGFEIGLS